MRSQTLLKYKTIDVFCVKNVPLSLKISSASHTSYRVRPQTLTWASPLDPTGTSVPRSPLLWSPKKSLNYTLVFSGIITPPADPAVRGGEETGLPLPLWKTVRVTTDATLQKKRRPRGRVHMVFSSGEQNFNLRHCAYYVFGSYL